MRKKKKKKKNTFNCIMHDEEKQQSSRVIRTKRRKMKKYEKTQGVRISLKKKKYVCKHSTKSLQNQKACPHLPIAAHSPDPHSYTQVDCPTTMKVVMRNR